MFWNLTKGFSFEKYVLILLVTVSCGIPDIAGFDNATVSSDGQYALKLANFELDKFENIIKINDYDTPFIQLYNNLGNGSPSSSNYRIPIPSQSFKIDLKESHVTFIEENIVSGNRSDITDIEIKEGKLNIVINPDLTSDIVINITSNNIIDNKNSTFSTSVNAFKNIDREQVFSIDISKYRIRPGSAGEDPGVISFLADGYVDVATGDLLSEYVITQYLQFKNIKASRIKGSLATLRLPSNTIKATLDGITGDNGIVQVPEEGKKELTIDITNSLGAPIKVEFINLSVVTPSGEIKKISLNNNPDEFLIGGFGFRDNTYYLKEAEIKTDGSIALNSQFVLFSNENSNISSVLSGEIKEIVADTQITINPIDDLGKTIVNKNQFIDYSQNIFISVKLNLPLKVKTKIN